MFNLYKLIEMQIYSNTIDFDKLYKDLQDQYDVLHGSEDNISKSEKSDCILKCYLLFSILFGDKEDELLKNKNVSMPFDIFQSKLDYFFDTIPSDSIFDIKHMFHILNIDTEVLPLCLLILRAMFGIIIEFDNKHIRAFSLF